MASSSFAIHARHHWTFQLVLLGSRLRLEGCCDSAEPDGEPLHCSTWLEPLDAPRDVANALIEHPSCCV
ncbi:hypothetical protein [Vulcanococcus sp.]|jgi:hypothetical protein|uniref:hypothetical protein n=1 Tax=Vulcanococcus sp. TaxID=2856995 RepID=UPI0037DA767A